MSFIVLISCWWGFGCAYWIFEKLRIKNFILLFAEWSFFYTFVSWTHVGGVCLFFFEGGFALSSENGLHFGIIENKFSLCSLFAPFLRTYWKDVYTAFCSDVMKLRNFQYRVKNLTTIDVLWDVSIRVVPYLLWCTFGAYNVIIITYIGVGFALLFRLKGNAKAPLRGTTAVEFHVFLCPIVS